MAWLFSLAAGTSASEASPEELLSLLLGDGCLAGFASFLACFASFFACFAFFFACLFSCDSNAYVLSIWQHIRIQRVLLA